MATIGSKAIEHLVMTRQLWFGYFSGAMEFTLPDHYQKWMREEVRSDGTIQKFATVSSICWATNLDVHKKLGHTLTATYDSNVYKKYDNLNALEVPELKLIPMDYDKTMGVPLSFVVRWDPEQFDIIGFMGGNRIRGSLYVDGENCFRRVLIKRKT